MQAGVIIVGEEQSKILLYINRERAVKRNGLTSFSN